MLQMLRGGGGQNKLELVFLRSCHVQDKYCSVKYMRNTSIAINNIVWAFSRSDEDAHHGLVHTKLSILFIRSTKNATMIW